MMEKQRARWLRRVIGGLEPTAEDIVRGLKLYRCAMRPACPACLHALSQSRTTAS